MASSPALIKRSYQFGDLAPERVSESDQHRKTRDFDSTFQIADEGLIGMTEFRELTLRELSPQPQLAQMPAEQLSFRGSFRHATDTPT
jgi:hypothetical protein